MKTRQELAAVLLVAMLAAGSAQASLAAENQTGIFVNGVPLSPQALTDLQRFYPVPIAPGRYWYDPMSGAYGLEGGPVAGQMLSGLNFGGFLQPNASNGTSGVFINGRQLTNGEKAYLEQTCSTPVVRGRYWVNAQGIGGYEGGPPAFNLAACRGGYGQQPGSRTRTFCDANGACTSTGILGTITTTP
jgi:hypothetical protein